MVSYVYEGFGKIIGQNGGGGGGSYQFCGLWGYRNDWDAGLMHVGARYYEIETGRFVQKDAWLGDMLYPQTLHGYVYARNEPIDTIDPTGYKPQKRKEDKPPRNGRPPKRRPYDPPWLSPDWICPGCGAKKCHGIPCRVERACYIIWFLGMCACGFFSLNPLPPLLALPPAVANLDKIKAGLEYLIIPHTGGKHGPG